MNARITKKQIQQLADNFVDKTSVNNDNINQRISLFQEILKQVEENNPNIGGIRQLASLLTLDQDKFSLAAPIFLNEFQKSINNVNDKLALAQTLNLQGLSLEQIKQQYDQIIKIVNEQFGEQLSQHKKKFINNMLGITYNAVSDVQGISKRTIIIPIEYCNENAKMPTYAHETDAGMDVYALEDITIAPGETKLIPIGIKVAIPNGYELQVRPKSGRSLKTKMRIANTPGTIRVF